MCAQVVRAKAVPTCALSMSTSFKPAGQTTSDIGNIASELTRTGVPIKHCSAGSAVLIPSTALLPAPPNVSLRMAVSAKAIGLSSASSVRTNPAPPVPRGPPSSSVPSGPYCRCHGSIQKAAPTTNVRIKRIGRGRRAEMAPRMAAVPKWYRTAMHKPRGSRPRGVGRGPSPGGGAVKYHEATSQVRNANSSNAFIASIQPSEKLSVRKTAKTTGAHSPSSRPWNICDVPAGCCVAFGYSYFWTTL
mmetsp:Transcript_134766/g.430652  ORF Transcript_134766/g.430652 Transcript_134766/m.430652 type:complete len:246 (-) Transcript_134766:1236-1973(-)